ncbi:MAG: pantothenate kinase, partial [Bacteroidales bacterium]|nr:pantothenate kinase [Bacteroidales bacterium]
KVNLQIKDISKDVLEGLPMHATASLFGKAVNNQVSNEDVAKGIIVMVLETIGSAAVLSTLNSGIKDFCMIGNLTRMEECREVFSVMEDLYGVRFHIPENAVFLTALGAALAYTKNKFQPL